MESFVISLLSSLKPEFITNIFILLIIFVFILGLVFYFTGRSSSFVIQSPTLLTSLGILGTFVGIIIGLLGFDANDIDSSIPILLEGLKVAFISSFIGMFFSILFKIIIIIFRGKKVTDSVEKSDADINDLLSVLKTQDSRLGLIHEAIVKDDNSSLIGQLKLIRSEISNKLDKQQTDFLGFQETLWVRLQDFADMLSKSATEQVIEALKEVIKDFNNNLVEQFGDNFKKLNESVERLVEWQENYRTQLNDMTEQYKLGVESIGLTEAAISTIKNDTLEIPKTMNDLRQIMEVNQHQLSELSSHLDAFKEIRDKAVEAVPKIQGQIDKIILGVEKATVDLSAGLSNGAETLSLAIIETSEDFKNNVNQTNEAMIQSAAALSETADEITKNLSAALGDMKESTSEIMRDFVSAGKDVINKFEQSGQVLFDEAEKARLTFETGMTQSKNLIISSLEEISTIQQNETQKILNGLSKEIEGSLRDTGEAVKKQINMIDDSMASEVNRVMNEMGKALGSITGQFTSDYTKLVDEMHKITRQK